MHAPHAQPPVDSTTTTQPDPPGIHRRIARLLRHRWSEALLRRSFPDAMVDRLGRRVGASEQRHSGQVRICVEGGLPWSYLWRGATARERAVTLFGKLRVWDTEHNNGVLIYLLEAEHAIEIVADRGLARKAPQADWDALVSRMRSAFSDRQYEDGLTQALAEVSAMLVQHFPMDTASGEALRLTGDLLDDQPLIGRIR